GQNIESAVLRKVAHVDAVGARRVGDVDVPVVAAAVDVDVAQGRFGVGGDLAGGNIDHAQDRLGAVPVLPEGGLSALHRLAREFPVRVQPVGIAYHAHDAILAVAPGQLLGDLGGQVPGRR